MNQAPTAIAFRATIQLGGKTATGIEVPEEVVAAGRFFEGLAYSDKQRFVLSIEGAKTDETRRRRIAKAVETPRAGRT